MKKRIVSICLAIVMLFSVCVCFAEAPKSESETKENQTDAKTAAGFVKMSEDEMYDRVLGSWLGQMIGVGWCAKTEFKHHGTIIPENEIPAWDGKSMYAEAYNQDDLYMEIPFLHAMYEHGYDCDPQFAAKNLAASTFPLWHGNLYARMNAQAGMPYAMCGSPSNNPHFDDIDFQIDVDFLGTMYPGLVNEAAKRAFDVGHLIGYGDGVYGGVFVSALHSAAYTASSVEQIVETAMNVIPKGSGYRDALDAVWECYKGGKTWEETWQEIEKKFNTGDSACPDFGSGTPNLDWDIDAKLNGAYIAIGLLFGKGDFEDSVMISCRCGQDSDCNPSNVASVLGTYYGASGLDEKYIKDASLDGLTFLGTVYTLRDAVGATFELLKYVLKDSKLESEDDGKWKLPASEKVEEVPLEQGKPADATVILRRLGGRRVAIMLETRGGEVSSCSYDMGDGFRTTEPLAMYTYEKAGTYKPTFTIHMSDGKEVKLESEVTVRDDPENSGDNDDNGIIICHVDVPKGGGSKDISVICDGRVSTDPAESYDTYSYITPNVTGIIGYLFRSGKEISIVRYSEGPHFDDGGWFKNGAPDLQVLVNGEWIKPEYILRPDYPVGDEKEKFEPAGLSYDFILKEPVKCDGVRLRGTCGGKSGFISVSELTVR